MTREQFIAYLKQLVTEAGSQKALAQRYGIGEPFLTDVLRGRRDPSERFLQALGFRRVVTYEKEE